MPQTRLQLRRSAVERYGLPPDPPQWVDAEWLNSRLTEAEREVAERTETIRGTCEFTGTSTARLYTMTTEFVRIMDVSWANNSALTRKTLDQIENLYGSNWRTATGHPQYWYHEGAQYLGICPKIRAGSAGTFIAYGPRYPRVLTADSGTTMTPTALHRAVTNYMCRELATMDPGDEDGKKEARWERRYEMEIGKYKQIRPYPLSITAPRNA